MIALERALHGIFGGDPDEKVARSLFEKAFVNFEGIRPFPQDQEYEILDKGREVELLCDQELVLYIGGEGTGHGFDEMNKIFPACQKLIGDRLAFCSPRSDVDSDLTGWAGCIQANQVELNTAMVDDLSLKCRTVSVTADELGHNVEFDCDRVEIDKVTLNEGIAELRKCSGKIKHIIFLPDVDPSGDFKFLDGYEIAEITKNKTVNGIPQLVMGVKISNVFASIMKFQPECITIPYGHDNWVVHLYAPKHPHLADIEKSPYARSMPKTIFRDADRVAKFYKVFNPNSTVPTNPEKFIKTVLPQTADGWYVQFNSLW